MKRNEMKNENSDNLAAMGIGAMIVFIALILVAAVASAVIIQTAEKLQQNAQSTGDQAQDQMASKVMPLSIVIQNGNTLRMTFELAPGSESITAQDVAFSVV
ncbi:MAG: flagellin, partial [Candidatus Poseidoniaceae archaeon]|nr:flagellin [Candidatus Poseidoniaceae archaeon]